MALDPKTIPLYPDDHQLGMRVAEGGSHCTNCLYYKGAGRCGNEGFIAWDGSQAPLPKATGSATIPDDGERYCCDLWE